MGIEGKLLITCNVFVVGQVILQKCIRNQLVVSILRLLDDYRYRHATGTSTGVASAMLFGLKSEQNGRIRLMRRF